MSQGRKHQAPSSVAVWGTCSEARGPVRADSIDLAWRAGSQIITLLNTMIVRF